VIEDNTDMKLLEEKGLEVIGAVYHLEDGHVEFLE
jgi:carbonic anhydrase